jgi:hypothetical protein
MSEDHRLDVARRAEIVRDLVQLPVGDRPVGEPGVEHGVDGQFELLERVGRKTLPRFFLVDAFEDSDQFPEIFRRQRRIETDALSFLQPFQGLFEHLPLDPHDGGAEHGDQPSVGVESEPFIARFFDQGLHGRVVQPKVQNRVHHPGHGKFRTGTHGNEERGFRAPELRSHRLLDLFQVGKHLFPHAGRILFPVLEIRVARLRGNGEPGGNRDLQARHVGQPRPFSAQQVLHLPGSVRLPVPEKINILFRASGHQHPPRGMVSDVAVIYRLTSATPYAPRK